MLKQTTMPIIWSEIYPVPCHDYWPSMNWSTAEQLRVYRAGMTEAAKGAALALNWGAMSNENCVAGMYDQSGAPTPYFAVAKEINDKRHL